MLKKFPSDKINGTKYDLFFLSRKPNHHSLTFNLGFLHELKHKVCLFKTVCRVLHFRLRFVFVKVYIFVQQNDCLKYINNLFKINETFRSFLHPRVKVIKEKSYIKIIYNVTINKICITIVYLRNAISKKMPNINGKLIIEARFKFCYKIGLEDLPFISLMWWRCNYLPVNCMTRVF